MTHHVDIQFASVVSSLPSAESIKVWSNAALAASSHDTELTVRIVDEQEIAQLNERFRDQQGTTNVLAFPAEVPAEAGVSLLGDVIICAPVVIAEAQAQGKATDAHWAHLVVHGILHLQGFDHQNEAQSTEMETCEVDILARLGYSNPYETGDPVADQGG